jgi:leucyl/phenylalanyl-tRNA--protein transferase
MYTLNEDISFPHPSQANRRGLLAMGGDLSRERLILAYSLGIFPWYNEGEPIYWYSLDPRMVLFPENLKVSKSMKQVLDRKDFTITYDKAFKEVMIACRSVYRPGQGGTWITDDMLNAYCDLHEVGIAHSVEAWKDGELVGGLYGVSLGRCFFGESMFSKVSNASKAAFITMVRELESKGFLLIDCQMYTEHLASLGAALIPRTEFLAYLEENRKEENRF